LPSNPPPSPHTLSVPLTHVCGCSALTGAIAATPSLQFSSPPWTTPEALSTPHHPRRHIDTVASPPSPPLPWPPLCRHHLHTTTITAFAAFAADDADADADAPSSSLLPISPPCRRRPPARLAVTPAATRPPCDLCACARVARCAPRTPCVQSSVRPTFRLPVGIQGWVFHGVRKTKGTQHHNCRSLPFLVGLAGARRMKLRLSCVRRCAQNFEI
jgi:hypothetical protein